MARWWMRSLAAGMALGAVLGALGCRQFPETKVTSDLESQGRKIFRDDTFGDEAFWTDTARLHEVIEKEIQPLEALSLGLKVDMDRMNLFSFLLHNPFGTSGTKRLLKQDAVVGLKATFDKKGHISRIGITCALCHSTVDNALLPGIGHRLDGWPNTDLKVGKILAMLKNFTEPQKAVFRGWSPGFYDPRINFDGKNTPLVLPPAHGLAQVRNETYTGDDTISYWNAYVAVTQMHGQGTFVDPRLGINIVRTPDLVTPVLRALREYQHSLGTPAPAAGSFDAVAAERGRGVFTGAGRCSSCHIPTRSFSDINAGRLHAPSETGMEPVYASRSVTKRYRTTPLRALWRPPLLQGPYFHDGSAATLQAVVEHYNSVRNLNLTAEQKRDLVEYLKTL